MKIKTPTEFQTFNDGICRIYRVENIAEPGKMPKDGLKVRYDRIPFERKKVGLARFYQAMQADVLVTDLIRIPKRTDIGTNDVCVIEGEQYQIKQAQSVLDSMPPSMDLTLERLEAEYDIQSV